MINDRMDIDHKILFIVGTILAGSSLIICTSICSAIIFSRRTRGRSFNLYLAALLIPDVVVNSVSLIINIVELSLNDYMDSFSHAGCVFLASVHGYYIFTNLWTSALICHEVYWLLKKSSKAIRFKPTKSKIVILRVAILHFSAIVGGLIIYLILPLVGIDITSDPCLGTESKGSFVFVIVLIILTIFPVLLYICYMTVDVYRSNLVPPTGKSRFVATFFIRTAILTIIFTLALAATVSIGKRIPSKFFDFLRSGQGIVIAGMSLMKPDVRKTTLYFVTCGMFGQKLTGPNIHATKSHDKRSISMMST